MTGSQSFTPREFLDSLRRDDIRRPVLLRGMVKPAEDDDQVLMFAHGSACENWIRVRVPVASIETVEFLNFVPCADHNHPLVLLHLKQPETDEGRLFSSLIQPTSGRTSRRPARLIRGPRSVGPRRTLADPGAGATTDSDFPWCATVGDYEVGADGSVWCLDYCWESNKQAVYTPC